MMCKKETIANLLINKSVNILFPKSEGEIEVPLQTKTKKEMGIGNSDEPSFLSVPKG